MPAWGGFRSFTATAANGEVAPIPVVHVTALEPLESTRSGHSLVLFDDLVGAGEDRWRDGEAERLGSVEIYG
jgi:hypothetical protein